MNDIEEAISYIENTKKHLQHLGEIWFANYLDDAIDLLKEQESVEPIRDDHGSYYCGACGKSCVGYADMNIMEVKRLQKYCSECGRAVKWDECIK